MLERHDWPGNVRELGNVVQRLAVLSRDAVVGLREGADPLALVETRRALGRPLQVQSMNQAEFDRRLSDVYAGDLSADEPMDMPSQRNSGPWKMASLTSTSWRTAKAPSRCRPGLR